MPTANQFCVDKLVEVVGIGRVKYDGESLGRYARSMNGQSCRPLAIVFPRNSKNVQNIVELANREGLKLYAICRGKNWGYGEANALRPGHVIVDLSLMNSIEAVDRELGYAVIEAGVSQGELSRYLKVNDLPLWMDSTAAGPDASLVGNLLDRGFGHTRYGDRNSQVCGMEVVLGDGSLLKTGMWQFEKSKAKYCYRYGVGPSLDGIFAQSNLGIVTKVCIWLMPKPESYTSFFFEAKNDEDLKDIIDRLSPMRRQGLLQSAIHVANDIRALSGRSRYPWDKTDGVTPLPQKVRDLLRSQFQLKAWTGCGAIYGTRGTVRAVQARLKEVLRGYKVVFVNDRKMELVKRIAPWLEKWKLGRALLQKVAFAKPIYDLMKGDPVGDVVRGACWRVRGEIADEEKLKDPLDTSAGLIWISPIVPMTGQHCQNVVNIMTPIFHKYGFDLPLTFTMLTERAIACVSNISFDQRNVHEMNQAHACYQEVMKALIAEGYIPYRTGPSGYKLLRENSNFYWPTVQKIKAALDPNGVLSPGRYLEDVNERQFKKTG